MIRTLVAVVVLVGWPAVGFSVDHGAAQPEGAGAASGAIDVVPDPTPRGEIRYINPNVPDFAPLEFPGDSYDALVPATLDPAERARLSVNFLTRTSNPNMDYEPYNMVELMVDPPVMWHHMGDFATQGKYLEVLPMARIMSGSRQNLDLEHAWLKVMLKTQGPDGLLYDPTSGRPWVLEGGGYMLPQGEAREGVEQVCTLGYGKARLLVGFCIRAQLDPDGPWRDAARRLAEGIKKTLIVDGDNAYMFDHWTVPGREVVKPEKPPLGIIAGGNAWNALALIQYGDLFDDAESIDLAEKLLHYIFFDSGYFKPDGRFMSEGKGDGWAHFHTHGMAIIAALHLIMRTGDKELLEPALKAYEYGIRAGDGTVGFFPEAVHESGPDFMGDQHSYKYHTSESCEVADMIIAAILFSKLGIDKWDDADRWTRNQYAENQLTQVNWITDGRLDYSKAVITDSHRDMFYRKGIYTNDNVAERAIGGFASHPSANDFIGHPEFLVSISNCCSGNGPRAFYYVWRDTLTYDLGEIMWTFDRPILRVNLLFNRASKWADVDSHIPYAGRVDVKVKQNLKLEVRIPEWVEPEQARCEVDGVAREPTFKGRYAKLGEVDAGQTAVLTFPIPERTKKVHIQGPPGGVNEYTLVLRGNTVVAIDPPGRYLPLYQRGHTRTGKTLWRKVRRFVSDDEIPWW